MIVCTSVLVCACLLRFVFDLIAEVNCQTGPLALLALSGTHLLSNSTSVSWVILTFSPITPIWDMELFEAFENLCDSNPPCYSLINVL